MDQANLFEALFAWRPREAVRPEENFLTEALVYVLRTNPAARDAWLACVLDDPRVVAHATFETRASYDDHHSGTTVFPDVKVTGAFEGGPGFMLLVEHKWGAAYDEGQLHKYARVLARDGGGRLAFVGAGGRDRRAAKGFAPPPSVGYGAFTWEEIHRALEGVADTTRAHTELLEFMAQQGLNPGRPLTPDRIEAFARGAGLLDQLWRYANKLQHEFDWSFIPAAYRPRDEPPVTNRWGRIALEFATPDWAPALTLGFLHDPTDHTVPFTEPGKSLDLMLRIEAHPKRHRQAALAALRAKAAVLNATGAAARVSGDPDNGNPHTLLIVQRSLTSVIDGHSSEQEQLNAVHGELRRWAEILFNDGVLEPALQTLAAAPASLSPPVPALSTAGEAAA